MARVSLIRATGKLIEYQSRAQAGTLTQNALRAGFAAAAIEEREVTEAEWAVIRDQWIDKPARDAKAAGLAARDAKAVTARADLNLSPAQWQILKDALGLS